MHFVWKSVFLNQHIWWLSCDINGVLPSKYYPNKHIRTCYHVKQHWNRETLGICGWWIDRKSVVLVIKPSSGQNEKDFSRYVCEWSSIRTWSPSWWARIAPPCCPGLFLAPKMSFAREKHAAPDKTPLRSAPREAAWRCQDASFHPFYHW